ncbi:hypothetical protein PAECIP111802_06856 [Paenibacillus allorhizosphaerae]|uniref:Uncharacterized protein n=1 Tax=Paenibacillus allorhizosphaerae TaxID=2849866 RepID=A0ABN7TVY6_9BACL|nr:hypothetical protein PAECIP111802_06856 [Paenibacillus allorhizosphaerae]
MVFLDTTTAYRQKQGSGAVKRLPLYRELRTLRAGIHLGDALLQQRCDAVSGSLNSPGSCGTESIKVSLDGHLSVIKVRGGIRMTFMRVQEEWYRGKLAACRLLIIQEAAGFLY